MAAKFFRTQDLIENPIREEPVVGAHAIVFAGEGRAGRWRASLSAAIGIAEEESERLLRGNKSYTLNGQNWGAKRK